MPTIGSENFPADVNQFYNMIQGVIRQDIEAAKNINPLSDSDACYFYDCKEGTGQVIEESIVKAAEARGWEPTLTGPSLAPEDPTVYTRYFSEWKDKQFLTTTRMDDIRRVIAGKGAGVEDLRFAIVNSLTQGDNDSDFIERRNLLFSSPVVDYSTINGGEVPKTMRGMLYMVRDMYNHMIANNEDCTVPAFRCAVPAESVRVAISSKLMNLVDVREMAELFNMSRAELFGKLVIVNVDDLPESMWYKVVVYDHKAMGVAEFFYDYGVDPYFPSARYMNHSLNVSRQYFYNSLFKAAALDCTAAAQAGLADILQARTEYTVTPTLNSVATLEPTPAAKIGQGMTLYTVVTPVAGKVLSALTVAVKMGTESTDITAQVYEETSGKIVIPAVTGNVTITVTE